MLASLEYNAHSQKFYTPYECKKHYTVIILYKNSSLLHLQLAVYLHIC